MRIFIKVLSALFIGLFYLNLSPINVYANPEISGEGMVLMDYITGEVLASKNPNEPMAPASTTKIMTALLTLENCNLDDMVKVGVNSPNAIGSSVGLKEGDEYSVEEMLHALLLESANDSAVALAEHIAGTEKEFAKMMNDRAKALGAVNTNFVNASGLYEDNHLTTPYDLALIMREVSKIPTFRQITSKTTYEMSESVVDGFTKWTNNRNSMLYQGNSYYYQPIICGKTGYTTKSRHTYTASAEKDGQTLVLSLLNYDSKPSYYADTKKMFDYGFETFKTIKLFNAEDIIENYKIDDTHSVDLKINEDVYYVVNLSKSTITAEDINTINDTNTLRNKLNVDCEINYGDGISPGIDLASGDKLFSTDIKINNKDFKSLDTFCGNDVTYTKSEKLSANIENNTSKYIKIAIISLVILFIVLLAFRIIYVQIRRKRRRNKRLRFSNYKKLES